MPTEKLASGSLSGCKRNRRGKERRGGGGAQERLQWKTVVINEREREVLLGFFCPSRNEHVEGRLEITPVPNLHTVKGHI